MSSTQTRTFSAAFLLVGLSACRKVEPAPTALDELMHFFFLEFESEDSDRLAEGVENLVAWHGADGQDDGVTGSLSLIGAEEKESVGLDGDSTDEWLKGVFEVVPSTGCTPREHGDIYAFHEQPDLFPGQYDAYRRTYHTDADCYRDGSCPSADWAAHIEGDVGIAKGSYDYEVQMRDLEGTDGQIVTMTRAWLPEPALVGDDEESSSFFDQSYSIEVFAPYQGATLHAYALWNSAGHSMLSSDSDFWERQYVKGVEDWNDRLDELCLDERDLWR